MEFYIESFDLDRIKTAFKEEKNRFVIRVMLEGKKIRFGDVYDWAGPFQVGGYDEDGEWVDEESLNREAYSFFCHYDMEKNELRLPENRRYNVGSRINDEVFEEFVKQHKEDVKEMALRRLGLKECVHKFVFSHRPEEGEGHYEKCVNCGRKNFVED